MHCLQAIAPGGFHFCGASGSQIVQVYYYLSNPGYNVLYSFPLPTPKNAPTRPTNDVHLNQNKLQHGSVIGVLLDTSRSSLSEAVTFYHQNDEVKFDLVSMQNKVPWQTQDEQHCGSDPLYLTVAPSANHSLIMVFCKSRWSRESDESWQEFEKVEKFFIEAMDQDE